MSALIPERPSSQRSEKVEYLLLEDIDPNPQQPRKKFDDEKIKEMVASIREHGVIQPVIVSPKDGRYQLIVGERRWRAAKLAGLKEIPVIIKDFTKTQFLEIALIENIQREDLNPIEKAQAFQFLINEYSFTQDDLARRIGKSRSAIANILRLLNLPAHIKGDLIKETISEGHGRALVSIEDPERRNNLWERIKKNSLSVRQTEKLAEDIKQKRLKIRKKLKLSADWLQIEEQLTRTLATKVHIKSRNKKRGKIEIIYASSEELERIVEMLLYLSEIGSSSKSEPLSVNLL